MLKIILQITIWLTPVFINISNLSTNLKLSLTSLYVAVLLILALINKSLKCKICGQKRPFPRSIKSLFKFIFNSPPECKPTNNNDQTTTPQTLKCQSYAILEKTRTKIQIALIASVAYFIIYNLYFSAANHEGSTPIILFFIAFLILLLAYHGIITAKCPLCNGSLFWDSYSWKTQFLTMGFILFIPHLKCPYCHKDIFDNDCKQ